MHLRRRSLIFLGLLLFCLNSSSANYVLNVKHKYGGHEGSLLALRAHDDRRHGRRLSVVDLPLGGDSSPTDTGLYYAKIGLGTPSKDYYVQVDTGSDLLWVNCAGCDKCPTKSDLGIELSLYDPKASSTGAMVTCEQKFCSETVNPSSCKVGSVCGYSVTYGDGSSSGGYFVTDVIQLSKASGDLKTTPMNGSVAFGCGSRQSGQLGTSAQAVDGIIGFGQSHSSVISQLALAGKVKKMFSHCLDGNTGGGIFVIGEVVRPKVKSAPMITNMPHYNVQMIGIEVNGKALQAPVGLFEDTSGKKMVIDSGTTLAYLEDDLFNPLMTEIFASQPGLKVYTEEKQFSCFTFSGNVDDGFPAVTFLFENSLNLTVYPHEYLFEYKQGWCAGWQNSGVQTEDGKDLNLLGDMVLTDKLVVYDVDNKTIGWTEYNCSSTVEMKDERSGAEYLVGSHDISESPAPCIPPRWVSTVLSLLAAFTVMHGGFRPSI